MIIVSQNYQDVVKSSWCSVSFLLNHLRDVISKSTQVFSMSSPDTTRCRWSPVPTDTGSEKTCFSVTEGKMIIESHRNHVFEISKDKSFFEIVKGILTDDRFSLLFNYS